MVKVRLHAGIFEDLRIGSFHFFQVVNFRKLSGIFSKFRKVSQSFVK